MDVSFVIIAGEGANAIDETLDSLRSQTRETWEAVVVCIASPGDAPQALVTRVEHDRRVRVIPESCCGVAAAWNVALSAARGEWCVVLDEGDRLVPHCLEELAATRAAQPLVDAIQFGSACVAADGTVVQESFEPSSDDLFAVLARGMPFPVQSCLVRKACVERVGGIDPALLSCAPWDLWQRVARSGAIFGSIRDVLVLRRMKQSLSAPNALQLFSEGLRVLRQGHAADPRVPDAHVDHAVGRPADSLAEHVFYLLTRAAAPLIARNEETEPLFACVPAFRSANVAAEEVARILYEGIPMSLQEAPRAWERLMPRTHGPVEQFLVRLEEHSGTPRLAAPAMLALQMLVLRASPVWAGVLERVQGGRDARGGAEVLARDKTPDRLETDESPGREALLQVSREAVPAGRIDDSAAVALATNALLQSPEHRLGGLLLNGLRLRKPILAAERLRDTLRRRIIRARLALERRTGANAAHPRVMATICDTFPIYSQTFVYEELTQLARAGFPVRHVYSNLDQREYLRPAFDPLWHARTLLKIDYHAHVRDFERYRRRMPGRVEALVQMLTAASPLSRDALLTHGNFLQAFTYTRMVEAWGPDYLHSYFFYDRSLMALVAAHLLGIPRGVSCYSDHLLADYDLKVVPLHLQLCDVVVATSNRIKDELLGLTPDADPQRILVKPNGIDTRSFPVLDRHEPSARDPFRLVTVCRIEPKKGLLELVEAVHTLRQRGVRVEAHVVGAVDAWSLASRDYKAKLDARITELDLWGTVHLEGRQGMAGLLRCLGAASAFVAPFVETETGDKDGIPTALLEAMATGLPVVATTAGSIDEVVTDGQEGLLVPPRDPAALADAIQILLGAPDRRAAMGAASARRVQSTFDAARREREFHERILSVVRARRRPLIAR